MRSRPQVGWGGPPGHSPHRGPHSGRGEWGVVRPQQHLALLSVPSSGRLPRAPRPSVAHTGRNKCLLKARWTGPSRRRERRREEGVEEGGAPGKLVLILLPPSMLSEAQGCVWETRRPQDHPSLRAEPEARVGWRGAGQGPVQAEQGAVRAPWGPGLCPVSLGVKGHRVRGRSPCSCPKLSINWTA